MEQRSNEWFAARLGKITASRINDVLATVKNGEAASRRNYRAQLVVERKTGEREEGYCNGAMQWGIDHEDDARCAYEFITGQTVEQVGFMDHPEIEMSGASPDGLVGKDGMVEIKCPMTAKHIDWLLAGEVPTEHLNQMQWQMEVAGRDWCDFISYDPRMPTELQIFVVRIERDDKRVDKIKEGVHQLLKEISDVVEKLTDKAIQGAA